MMKWILTLASLVQNDGKIFLWPVNVILSIFREICKDFFTQKCVIQISEVKHD